MRDYCSCLVAFALVCGSLVAAAEEDEFDVPVPAWELPADALQPQNVRARGPFEELVAIPDVLLDEKQRDARKKPLHSNRPGEITPLHAGKTKDADDVPKSMKSLFDGESGRDPVSGKVTTSTATKTAKTQATGAKVTRSGNATTALRDGKTHWEDDTAEFNQQAAAIVNGGRILNGEVLNLFSFHLKGTRQEMQDQRRGQSEYNKFREKVVEHLLPEHIQNRLLLDAMESTLTAEQLMALQAHQDVIVIKMIKRELKVSTDEALERELKTRGTTLPNMKRGFIVKQLAKEYAQYESAKGKPVGQQEALAYYESHMADYAVPVNADWEQIQISFDGRSSKAKAQTQIQVVLEELESGVPVAEVARKYSDGPSARKGGKWESMEAGTLVDTKLERMLFEMPIGEWSAIYEGSNAMQLVRVLERREAGQVPFSRVEAKLRETLEQQRIKQRQEELVQKLLQEAKIETKYDVPRRSVMADDMADATAPERDSWLGKQIFLKLNTEWKPAAATAWLEHIQFPATITDVDGEWVNVDKIWVRKNDIMEAPAALDYYTDQISLNPRDANGWAGRGTVWQRKGCASAAIADYTEAIRRDPQNAPSYCFRGIVLSMQGKYADSIKDLTEAIRLDPDYPLAYCSRGIALSENVNVNGLGIYLLQGGEVAVKRGNPWTLSRNVDVAIKDFTIAIRLDPNMNRAYDQLAWLLATCPDEKLRDGKRAVELATNACQLSRWSDRYEIATLAAAHAEAGDWENAVQRQEQAIELLTKEKEKQLLTHEKEKQEAQQRLELYTAKKPYRGMDRKKY